MSNNFEISIAPMVKVSFSEQRQLWRMMTKKSLIYGEMVHANAILHGEKADSFIYHSPEEKPIAFQLAGRNPEEIALASKVVQNNSNWQEINLNAGCPSPRVQKGSFGLILMREPNLIQEILSSMQEAATSSIISLKCRIGIADDEEDWLNKTLEAAIKSGCKKIILHARKGYLGKMSPKKNRKIPVINHKLVERTAKSFPELDIILNGEIYSLEDVKEAKKIEGIKGIMIGRMARDNPHLLLGLDDGDLEVSENKIKEAILKILSYINEMPPPKQQKFMIPLSRIVRGIQGAKKIRILINDNAISWKIKQDQVVQHLKL